MDLSIQAIQQQVISTIIFLARKGIWSIVNQALANGEPPVGFGWGDVRADAKSDSCPDFLRFTMSLNHARLSHTSLYRTFSRVLWMVTG
jgi:hypothetical protein